MFHLRRQRHGRSSTFLGIALLWCGVSALAPWGLAVTPADCPQFLRAAAPSLQVGLVQYEIGRPVSLVDWEAKIERYIAEAAQQKDQLVLFPELFSLEGLALIAEAEGDPALATRELARRFTPHFLEKFSEWSHAYGVAVVAGTWPVLVGDDVHNVAFLFGPDGKLLHRQAKNHLTHDEKALYRWNGARGGMLRYTLANGITIGIAICFDSEFPNFMPTTKGAIPEILLVPSMTGDDFGRYRVRRAASARAVEHHAYVVVTGTVGGKENDPLLGIHAGQAVAFAPSDVSFPANGILTEGALNQRAVVSVKLDLDRLRHSRKQSTTFPAKLLQEEPDNK